MSQWPLKLCIYFFCFFSFDLKIHITAYYTQKDFLHLSHVAHQIPGNNQFPCWKFILNLVICKLASRSPKIGVHEVSHSQSKLVPRPYHKELSKTFLTLGRKSIIWKILSRYSSWLYSWFCIWRYSQLQIRNIHTQKFFSRSSKKQNLSLLYTNQQLFT